MSLAMMETSYGGRSCVASLKDPEFDPDRPRA